MAHPKLYTFVLGIFAAVETVSDLRSVMCRYTPGWTNSQYMNRDEDLPGMLQLASCTHTAAEDPSGCLHDSQPPVGPGRDK